MRKSFSRGMCLLDFEICLFIWKFWSFGSSLGAINLIIGISSSEDVEQLSLFDLLELPSLLELLTSDLKNEEETEELLMLTLFISFSIVWGFACWIISTCFPSSLWFKDSFIPSLQLNKIEYIFISKMEILVIY